MEVHGNHAMKLTPINVYLRQKVSTLLFILKQTVFCIVQLFDDRENVSSGKVSDSRISYEKENGK